MKRWQFRRFGYEMKNNAQTSWHENKWLAFTLLGCAIVGIIFAIIAINDPLLTHFRISIGLIDGNIVNAASPDRGPFSFIFSRFLDFGFAILLVILFCMTKWTSWLTFPFIAFRAFWSVINLFFIVDRFGFFHGMPLFIVYLIVFVFTTIIFICACIFVLKRGRLCRLYGSRVGYNWNEIKRAVFAILTAVVVVALIEWLLYFLILSRLAFVIV
ncbi:MAG: hypothetical protein FWE16_01895 [Firmicutes bacterium]|nr:hypothetical protein [Bacillota bacterium]